MLVRSLIVALFLAIVWLRAGRQITLLLDHVATVGVRSLPVSPLRYDGGGFRIGGLSLTFGATNNLRFPLALASDTSSRVILSAGGRSFTLGPRTNPVDTSGRVDIDFIPDPSDNLSLTVGRSPLSWPTPFEYHFMGGPSPWWKRYVYYRLAWKKPSGAKLEMRWRYEQQFYSAKSWSAPLMMWNGQTGLLSVDIHPSPAETAVVLHRSHQALDSRPISHRTRRPQSRRNEPGVRRNPSRRREEPRPRSRKVRRIVRRS